MLTAVLLVVAAYAAGMFPTAHLVGRHIGHDPTAEGSGNPGASNVYRLGGRWAGAVVALIDVAKGAVPVGIALLVAGRPEAHAAWVAAVTGHVWPVIRGFRGGKGVATAGGGGLVIGPVIGVACGLLFLAVVRVGHIASLGSLAIAVAYPVLAALVGRPWWEVAVAAGVAAIVVLRHRGNIMAIVHSDERRLDGPTETAA